ncbi:MAG: uroporphyrinogen decarboxylase family protein [Patescibacteria group bacterium]
MKKESLSPKERMLIAMRNGVPDRVPVTPDISNMIPAKLTGRPFWDVYHRQDPPLWRAYLAAVRRYGIDGWFWYVGLGPSKAERRSYREEIVARTEDSYTVRTYCRTPAGELWQETVYRRDNPPAVTRKYIKDLRRDFKHLPFFFPDPAQSDDAEFQEAKKAAGDDAAVGFWINYPALMFDLRDGQENCYYDYYDHHDLLKEWEEMWDAWAVRYTERALDAKPDFIQTGHSGTLTLQSPEIFRDIGLRTLQKITRLCRQAGVPTMLHSCGKEAELVRICAEETDLCAINPLEPAPMGDCDLGEIKRLYGRRLALMGNVGTTTPMLTGTPDEVEAEVRRCLAQAAEGGGFILSTADQCGRDTPEENLRRFVDAGRKYGRYDGDRLALDPARPM